MSDDSPTNKWQIVTWINGIISFGLWITMIVLIHQNNNKYVQFAIWPAVFTALSLMFPLWGFNILACVSSIIYIIIIYKLLTMPQKSQNASQDEIFSSKND